MFNKVLVAEDSEGMHVGVGSVLQRLGVPEVFHAQYCDEAYLKFKKAYLDRKPYELLICDLSFKSSHRMEKIRSGRELIEKLKAEQPGIKIIVFSVEDHPRLVNELWGSNLIEGYVCKDRTGLKELSEAVLEVYKGQVYLSPQLAIVLGKKNLFSLKQYDEYLLTLLAKGLNQHEIENKFKKEGISPNSKSSIEKRLKELREEFNAHTTVHLITIVKDLRLI